MSGVVCAPRVTWRLGARVKGVFSAQGKTSLFSEGQPAALLQRNSSDFFWEEASPRDAFNRVSGERFLHEHRHS